VSHGGDRGAHGLKAARALPLLLAALLVLPALPLHAADAQSSGDPWWGVSDKAHPTQGYAIRAPLVFENPFAFALVNPVASVDIDFGKLLLDAGWSSAIRAGANASLTAFTLDEASIRVVDYGRSGWSTGPVNGQSTLPTPAVFYPGPWHADHSAPYNNQTNPVGTLLVSLKGLTLAPHEKRYFYVYANPREFEAAPASPPTFSLQDRAPLDAYLWGSEEGTTFYGLVPQQGGTQRYVVVHPTQGEAIVTLWTLDNGKFSVAPGSAGTQNPTRTGFGVDAIYQIPPNKAYKITSDNPVVVADFRADAKGSAAGPCCAGVESQAYVPSLDGSYAGTRFLVYGFKGDQVGGSAGSITLVKSGSGTATVTWSCGAPFGCGGGATPSSVTLSPASPTAVMSIPAGQWSTLTASAPVLVRLHPFAVASSEGEVAHSVPALTGGPEGTEFYVGAPNDGGLYRVCTEERLVLRAVSLGKPSLQAFPEGPADTTAPLHLDTGCADQHAQTTTPAAPLDFYGAIDPRTGEDSTQVPFRMTVGAATRNTDALARPSFGPVGGVGGVDFDTYGQPGISGRVAILGHYNQTFLTVTEDKLTKAGLPTKVNATYGVNADGFLVLDPTRDPLSLASYHISATKPVSVVYDDPMQSADGLASYAYARMVPSEPVGPRGTFGPAEFRGPLVALRSPDAPGRNLLVRSGGPGEPMDFRLDVVNLGRWIAGDGLPDTVSVSCDAPQDWKVAGCSRDVPLASGAVERLQLSITPSAADVNLTRTVTVTAQSKAGGSPATFTFHIHVEVNYGVGMWFDVEGGRKTIDPPVGVDPGQTYHYNVLVKNTGSTGDTYDLTVKAPQEGWSQALLLDGKPARTVTLDAGETKTLDFAVTAPNQETAPKNFVSITAQSESALTAGDVVNTATQIRPKINITLALDPAAQVVAPGANATFNLTVNNSGNGEFLIRLANDSDLPKGWTSRFSVDPPEINLDPGTNFTFRLDVTPPLGSRAGDLATLKVTALVGEDDRTLQPGDEVGAVVVVRRIHDITTPNLPDAEAEPGETLRYLLPVANAGNGNDIVEILPGAVDPAWRLTTDSPSLAVDYNATEDLPLSIEVPPGAAAGLTNLTFTVRLSREATENLTVPIQVRQVARLLVEAPAALLTSPGKPTSLEGRVTNVGNLAGEFDLSAAAPQGWNATLVPARATLGVGDSLPLRLLLNASRDAADGDFPVALQASFADGPAGGANVTTTLARPLLYLSSVQTTGTLSSGDLVLVSAAVGNKGAIAAENVTVALVVDGAAVDKVVLSRITVNDTKVATLNWVATGKPKEVRVVIDPQQDIVQSTRDNTQQVVTFGSRLTPAPGALAALAVACAAALLSARRRKAP